MTQEELNDKLLDAVYKNDIAGVKEVLSLGADVNSADAENWTSLMNAAWYGYTDVGRLLIEHNADINAADKYGQTALIHACEYGYTDIVRLLLEHGADTNAANECGNTSLMWACRNGHTDTVQLLIEHGADISLKDKDGKTALDILQKRHPYDYLKLVNKLKIKQKQKKLLGEDTLNTCEQEPDFNI